MIPVDQSSRWNRSSLGHNCLIGFNSSIAPYDPNYKPDGPIEIGPYMASRSKGPSGPNLNSPT